MTTKRILLIDDEETIQEVVQVGLDLEVGWEVLSASSGPEGILVAETEQPDAILLDVMMPDMDGISTLLNLKSNVKTESIPVIFLTAKTQTADKKQFNNLEIIGVITKPFNSLTLAGRIAKLLHWEL
ncbi:MAG: response regulator [Xenococcaceae cyanobacterium]